MWVTDSLCKQEDDILLWHFPSGRAASYRRWEKTAAEPNQSLCPRSRLDGITRLTPPEPNVVSLTGSRTQRTNVVLKPSAGGCVRTSCGADLHTGPPCVVCVKHLQAPPIPFTLHLSHSAPACLLNSFFTACLFFLRCTFALSCSCFLVSMRAAQ